MFLYKKTIDRSALREGFSIPTEYHPLLHSLSDGVLKRGETRKIKIILNGQEYDALLKNQAFDTNKFVGHTDVIQIRYGINSPLAKKFREIFQSTWNYVEKIKALPENVKRKFTINIPDEIQEFLIINTTELPNVFMADCILCSERAAIKSDLKTINEWDFEQLEDFSKHDPNATITYKNRLNRIRILDRSIGDSLKKIYDYRCQMTGEKIGATYGALCVEAHHIDPFTKSLNNDYSNIIILSPNYHRIIHKSNPTFDRDLLAFTFPNGLVERIKLNKHLKNNQIQ